ncbi:MAG: ABC transporter substrate-binding protein [Firmicutes bacterium]|nr:ABC transporter substrate-binding protein [Bacillota bacterium]MDY6160363.1 ABC transporter substrate-binding protein [Candidatus Faecousia sp.]
MKKLISVLLLLCFFAALPVCAQGEAIQVGALTGPTAMGMVRLLEDGKGTYEPTILGAADELVPLILQGEIDIASVPANLAATLYNKTQGGITVLAVNVLGVLYIGEYNTENLQSLADLKGQTIYATGKGSTPEYFLRYVLSQNGIDPDKDVTVEWKSEPSEVVALLNAEQKGIAMLPQPYVTAAAAQLGEGFRVALSLSDEWAALDNGTLCTTAVVMARKEFAEQNPEAVEQFLTELEASVAWVNENVEDAAQLCGDYGIIKAPVAQKAIPQCNLVCITGADMQQSLSGCLNVIFEENPKAVGGALPESDFYYGGE